MHRQQLLQYLENYQTPFMDEAAIVVRARDFVRAHENCFDRELEHAHVTGSSWVLNPARTHVLMLHHRKLDLWLQPGGHADGDPDMLKVVLKETSEETGLDLSVIKLLSDRVFDVDQHVVHANEHFDRHMHFDIRFLVEIDDQIPLPGNNESFDLGWVPLNRVLSFNNARSFFRMVQKTRRLFR